MRFNLRQASAGVAAVTTLAMGIIVGFEGKSNTAYPDPVEIPTICYGHTKDVQYGDYRTDEECLEFLEEDVAYAEAVVDRLVKVPLEDHTKAALISFVYNVGEGNFARSTLLRKLNAGDYTGACNELPRWVYSKGTKLRGLVRRREAERQLCLGD